MVPFTADRSLWQTPQAPSFTVTSPALGPCTVMVSTTTRLVSRNRAALAWKLVDMGVDGRVEGCGRLYLRPSEARHSQNPQAAAPSAP